MVSDGTVLRVWNWCVNTTIPIQPERKYRIFITVRSIDYFLGDQSYNNDFDRSRTARHNDRKDEIVFASLCCRKLISLYV
mgnify:CR=1 FL=1